MAVRNGERYLREALDSVLSQSIADFELLVVNDASTDSTADILADYERRDSRMQIIRNEQPLGPYPSANRALRRARGRYIARHDADDVSPPDRFALQLAAFGGSEDASLVTGGYQVISAKGRTTGTTHPPSWQPRLEWELLFTNAVGAGAHVMFPRLVRDTPVAFEEQHAYAEDYELWCRLSRLGRVVCPEAVVYRYRQHGSSITSLNSAQQRECLSQIRYRHQSQYRPRSDASREAVDELSQFWLCDGRRLPADRIGEIRSRLGELRETFLAEIERRYGLAERSALEAELERALSGRLGYWLYRSMRSLDRKACIQLLAGAGAQRQTLNVSFEALKWVTRVPFDAVRGRRRQP
jgi:glycosyltransferase involved in cell wall biosynthesis